MNQHQKRKAEILKALGHPVRYCIVEGLLAGERNVTSIMDCVSLPQPTVSRHLQILKSAGILEVQRIGNEMHYSVTNDEARKIVESLK
ncbi:MAG: metalloregulator ArsR/SmtB family transcription factor [bacterium]|nr:metalloregulator ArsR/SmtB family transcription factor [bacterium]